MQFMRSYEVLEGSVVLQQLFNVQIVEIFYN